MNKLRVGIIGFGRIGAEHAGWIAASGAAEVAAVCDPTPLRLEKARQHPLLTGRDVQFVAQWQRLITLADLDAVLVSTPSAMHHQQVMASLSARPSGGLHVMVEKPMALDLAQARQMVQQAQKCRRILSVFHNRRWDADYLRVRQVRNSGVLGKWINVESRLHQYASCVGPAVREYRPNWRNEAAFGGGGLYDWGSHFVDQLWQLMLPAKPIRVFAQLRSNVWSSDCDDFARLCIDFDDHAVGLLEINCTTALPLPRWHIDGTRGTVQSPSSPTFDVNTWADLSATPSPIRTGASSTVGNGDQMTSYSSPLGEVGRGLPYLIQPLIDGPVLSAAGAPTGGLGFSSALPPLLSPGLTESDIWRTFIAAARGEGHPAVPARSVLPTMLLLDAARLSSRQGQAVDVRDPFNELLTGCV